MKSTALHRKEKPEPGFKIIPHPSDIGLEAVGKNFQEALAQAAQGLFSLMTDAKQVRPVETKEVSVSAADDQELVVNWLNELIFIFETKHWVPVEFLPSVLKTAEGWKVKGKIKGEKIDPRRHLFKIEIKAATYNRLAIEKKPNFVRIQVVFDV